MKLRTIIGAALAAALVPTPALATPGPEAETYLMKAIAILREHHRNSGKVDWPTVTADALRLADDAKTTADTYPAINSVLAALKERHSFLIGPDGVNRTRAPTTGAKSPAAAPLPPALPSWRIVDKRFGEVALTGLNTLGPDGEKRGDAYRAAIRTGLQTMDKVPLCGWIIDLRPDIGGNMWPMLDGLDPLLGKAPFGFFVTTGQTPSGWQRGSGGTTSADTPPAMLAPAFGLRHEDAPVALLLGPKTASSGEMVALALIGRDRVRTFGNPTAGYTSANKPYALSDGAVLVVTETGVADRTGRDYSGPIAPDETVADDAVEAKAEAWLATQCT